MKKHIWDDMPAGPSCPREPDSDESSFNDDEPTPSEEEYFSSDYIKMDTCGWQKPITRTQQRMFEELEKYTYEPWDAEETVMHKRKQRCTILSAYRDVMLNKRVMKALARLSMIKAMKFASREDEAYHLLNLEIVDKKLNRPFYYSDDEPATYRLLLQKRRRAIKRKYDEYKLTKQFHNTLEKRVYGSLAQQKNVFYEGDDAETSSESEDEAAQRLAEDSYDRSYAPTINNRNVTCFVDPRKKERQRQQKMQDRLNASAPGGRLNVSFDKGPSKSFKGSANSTMKSNEEYSDGSAVCPEVEFESYDGEDESPYDIEKIFGKSYDQYKGIDKSMQSQWGDLDLSEILKEGGMDFNDDMNKTINTSAHKPPSIPITPITPPAPPGPDNKTVADQLTDKYQKIIKDSYFPGAMDDAVNKLHDFNKLVYDIDSSYVSGEEVFEEKGKDGEKKPLSLIAAFDLRVRLEQEQMKNSFMPLPVSDISITWSPEKCGQPTAEEQAANPDKKPEPTIINREELLRASAAAIDIRNSVRDEPENDVLRAIGCLHRAETMNEYDKTVQAAEEAAKMAPPEYAEKAAVYGARTFRTEKVEKKSANIDGAPGYKPLEIISYIGMTRPHVENLPNY